MTDLHAVVGTLTDGPADFLRVTPQAHTPGAGDTLLAEITLPLSDATVRVLRPFSWDAKYRAFEVDELPLADGRILVSGPYAAADAAALNAGRDLDLRDDDGTDMTRYLAHGETATARDRHQDAAGWCTIEGRDPDGAAITLALALDYSGTTLVDLSDGLIIRILLPWRTFSPASEIDLPGAFVRAGVGLSLIHI